MLKTTTCWPSSAKRHQPESIVHVVFDHMYAAHPFFEAHAVQHFVAILQMKLALLCVNQFTQMMTCLNPAGSCACPAQHKSYVQVLHAYVYMRFALN